MNYWQNTIQPESQMLLIYYVLLLNYCFGQWYSTWGKRLVDFLFLDVIKFSKTHLWSTSEKDEYSYDVGQIMFPIYNYTRGWH